MPAETMNNKEAIDMMVRCKDEIRTLRARIDHLKPKADAYDNIAIVLRLLPQQSIGQAGICHMGEDVIWTLDKRIRELAVPAAKVETDDHNI
jgi:hypothetical protein